MLKLLPCVFFIFSTGYATDRNNISKLKADQEFIIYTIISGDSLSKLAKRYYGDPKKFYLIEEYNELKNPNHVIVGQKIKIPKIGMSFTLNQEEFSTERTIQPNLNKNDNIKKFRLPFLMVLIIIIGVVYLLYIIKRDEKPHLAKKDIRNSHDLHTTESIVKRSYQPASEKYEQARLDYYEPQIKQTFTHSFEYDETEGCEYYIVRHHPSGKLISKEKV